MYSKMPAAVLAAPTQRAKLLGKSFQSRFILTTLLALFGLGMSESALAGCSQDISYTIYPSHIFYEGQCATQAQAQATCEAIATEHGYGANYCGPYGFPAEETIAGGWFWELLDVKKEPFHFSINYYGSGLKPKKYKSQGAPDCDDQCVGDPINAATGNKFEHRVEFRGTGDFPLEVSWDYNYHFTTSFTLPSTLIFGTFRTHYYGRSVIALTSPQTKVAYVARPNGNATRFELINSVWRAGGGNAEQLTELLDGTGVRTGWLFKDAEGGSEHYNAAGILTGLTSLEDRVQTLAYDTSGRLLSVTDDQGRSIQYEYNAANHVSRTVLPDGNSLYFRYAPGNILSEVEYPGGAIIQYRYNEPEYATINTSAGALTGVIDESAIRYSSTYYDKYERATGTNLGSGLADVYSTSYTSGTLNYSTSTTIALPKGATRTMAFTVSGGKAVPSSSTTTCAGCESKSVGYTYDANGNLDVVTTNGISRDSDQDNRGRLTQIVEASNIPASKRTVQTDWHSELSVPTERRTFNAANTLVAKSNWSYNLRGQALTQTQTDPVTSATRTTSTTYCEQADITAGICPFLGLIKSIDGPRTDVSDVTIFTYRMADEASCATSPTTCPYRKGDLWKVTNALGQVIETLKYDGAGRVLSAKDANAVITDMDYHPRGWLTARKLRGPDPAVETDDAITRIDYWPTGLVKKVTQPDGAFTAYTYDAAHRLTDITDASGNTIHYTLDNAGNKTQEDTKDAQGALKRTLSQVYNQLGQLQTQKDAAQQATGFTYDANGNTDTVTDALTRVTDNDYDPLNRLQRTLQDVGGINAETKFQYDALDNLTQVTDPKGLNTQYTYNGLGDLTRLTSPDTGITNYTYDSAGNRKTQVDARNKTSTYSYDALNRLTGITYAATSLNAVYTYDATQTVCASGETFSTGRLTKLTDGSGTTQYCHDRFGQLVRKVQVSNGKTFTLRYGYTLGGQLSRITYPNNLLVDYVRDGQGRVTQIGVTPSGGARQVLVTGATYAPFGPVTGWTYGNGRTMQRTLNQNYQPSTIDGGPGGLSLGYGFDPVGNLTTLRTALQTDPPVATYGYDRLNRLSDVRDGPAGTVLENYGYDATGNRLSVTAAGTTTAYTYPTTNHRLSKVGTVTRSYDATGNTTQIGGTARQFVYNDLGRMSQVKAGTTVKMTYLYNGKGEQVRKYLGTANTYTLYDEAGHWLGDYGTTGAPVQQTVWLDDLPVGVMVGATTNQKLHYIEPDHLGTPRVVIDPVRNVAVWKWDLKGEAFGATVPDQNPDGDGSQFVFGMRYPGQRYDAASGMNYNYLRDGYESLTGRYSQSDPIGQSGGLALYGYVFANPFTYSDFYGLSPNCRIEAQYDGGYTATDYRKSTINQSKTGSCIPIPQIASPGPIDFIPDPSKWRQGRWPFSLPIDFGLFCETSNFRRVGVEQRKSMRIVNLLVCRDECGNKTSSTYVSEYFDHKKWEFLRFEDESSKDYNYYPPGTF